AEFDALVIDRAFKEPVMVRTADRFELVLRRFGRVGLEDFLQFPLGIFQIGNDLEFSEFLPELAEDKIARGVEAGVEKDRAQQGFEGIRQRGGAHATPAGVLTAAENQVLTQTQPAALMSERAA